MVVKEEIRLKTKGNTDIIDITDQVMKCVRGSGIDSGAAVVFVVGSTGAVSTVEYEPGLVKDLSEALQKIAPVGKEYHHDMRWGDGNGYAHVRATLMGPSLSVPFSDGRLLLGTWQQIVFFDFDNRPRTRTIAVQIMGE